MTTSPRATVLNERLATSNAPYRPHADCGRSLSVFPKRGARRDDLRPGLRILGFERRAAIALQATAETVVILRILYGGRD
jgi:toxin ParE1/3/4